MKKTYYALKIQLFELSSVTCIASELISGIIANPGNLVDDD